MKLNVNCDNILVIKFINLCYMYYGLYTHPFSFFCWFIYYYIIYGRFLPLQYNRTANILFGIPTRYRCVRRCVIVCAEHLRNLGRFYGKGCKLVSLKRNFSILYNLMYKISGRHCLVTLPVYASGVVHRKYIFSDFPA